MTIPWWLYLAILVLLGVVELIGLATGAKGDTLSEYVWRLLSHPTWGKFLTWMISAFLLWLTVHFATHGRLA
jgi:hypothetical protein